MKKISSVMAVTLAFIGGVEVGVAMMAYGALWVAASIKTDLDAKPRRDSRVSYRRYSEE